MQFAPSFSLYHIYLYIPLYSLQFLFLTCKLLNAPHVSLFHSLYFCAPLPLQKQCSRAQSSSLSVRISSSLPSKFHVTITNNHSPSPLCHYKSHSRSLVRQKRHCSRQKTSVPPRVDIFRWFLFVVFCFVCYLMLVCVSLISAKLEVMLFVLFSHNNSREPPSLTSLPLYSPSSIRWVSRSFYLFEILLIIPGKTLIFIPSQLKMFLHCAQITTTYRV